MSYAPQGVKGTDNDDDDDNRLASQEGLCSME
jgi:hypothetical protein